MGRPVMWAIFVEICNPDKVKQFIEDEDTYELFEIVRHYDYEDCYLFNIWGDEDEERINYKLEDRTAEMTARSQAGSLTLSPPAIFRKTSFWASLKPALRSRTARSIFSRRTSNPVAERCAVP